jgi:hypothetical protein
MSERMSKRNGGKPGRQSKGPRSPLTVRFPLPLREAIETARPGTGYDSASDYVVAVLERAHAAGLFPTAGSAGQEQLPISA